MKRIMILIACIAFALGCMLMVGCGSSEEEQETTEATEATEATETTEAAVDASAYGYTGEDPVEAAVYEYLATEIAKGYEPGEDMISVPVVSVVERVDNEDGSADVWGDFEIYNYKVNGDTLETQSGGSHPGKMHVAKENGVWKVTEFEQVQDGGNYDSSAKEIFGDKYDAFVKVSSDDKARDELRGKILADYVKANGLTVTKYQDYGWDPVNLPL